MVNQNNIYGADWCNIVFEGRNKEFGAYDLRKRYAKNALIAIISAIAFFLLAVSTPLIIKFFQDRIEDVSEVKVMREITLADAPPINKDEPPPIPVEPPPPLKSTIKFTPPVIVKDEEVTDETPPTQTDMEKVDAGAKTEEGDSLGIDPSLVENNDLIGESKVEEIFTIVEQMPTFPGGNDGLFAYLGKSIKYPPAAKANGITGKVFVNFTIGKNGEIRDIKIIRGVHDLLDNEAIRVVKNMPTWKAGKQNGVAVSVSYNLPINFILK